MCNQREYLNGSSQIDLVLCAQMFDNSKERGYTALPLLINFIIRLKLRDLKKNLIHLEFQTQIFYFLNAVPELSA